MSRTSSNFDQIRLTTRQLAALEFLKNLLISCWHSSGFIFYPTVFILVGNEDKYNISDEFEFWPDSTKVC